MIKCPVCGRYIAKTDDFCGWCEADRRKQGMMNESDQDEMVLEPPPPFYRSAWFLWLALILVAPIGIFLLWKYHDWPKAGKWVLSVFFAALFTGMLVLLLSSLGSAHDPQGGGTDSSSGTVSTPQIRETVVIRDKDRAELLKIGDEALLDTLYDIGIQTIWKVSINEERETIRILADVTNDILIQYQDGALEDIYNDVEPRRYYYCADNSHDVYSYRTDTVIMFANAAKKAEREAREKEAFKSYSYDNLLKYNTAELIGTMVRFDGTVHPVSETDEMLKLRVDIDGDEEQVAYVYYAKTESRALNFDEGAYIRVYGQTNGSERYLTDDQTERFVPRISARYIDPVE